jgi:hypothetical protein
MMEERNGDNDVRATAAPLLKGWDILVPICEANPLPTKPALPNLLCLRSKTAAQRRGTTLTQLV